MDCLNCGHTIKLSKKRPKNWVDVGYLIIRPYDLKWRHKLGKVECNCKEMEELYEPYYGFTLFHSEDCAMMKHLKRYPGICNLVDVSNIIAQSE
jgi:hypothetical protein